VNHRISTLLFHHAYETGTFILANGGVASEYLDVKNAILHATAGWELAVETAHAFGACRAVAGVAVGGAMLARLVSSIRSKPCLVVRPEVKSYGKQRQIDGVRNLSKYNEPGDAVETVLIEDVITTGKSVVTALHALAREVPQCKVTEVIAVCDREADGLAYLRQEFPAIKFTALVTLSEVRSIQP